MFEYAVLLNETRKLNGQRKASCFADPLEAAEWRGLEWSLRLFGYGEPTAKAPIEQRQSQAGPALKLQLSAR
jgi:hypothetical protein